MRGNDATQQPMFSYVSLESRIPEDHPLRPVRRMVDRVLAGMSDEFAAMYSRVGRPSIAPERLLRALLLQVLYTIRSERMLIEQLDYNCYVRCQVRLELLAVNSNHSAIRREIGTWLDYYNTERWLRKTGQVVKVDET